MTNVTVANFLQELNAAGVEQLIIGKDGNHVTCLVLWKTGAGSAMPHAHIRCLPINFAGLLVQVVNGSATLTQPLTTDGT